MWFADRLQLILGIWLLVSPWMLGFSEINLAKWSCVLVGLGILFAVWWNVLERKN
jgi:hypothetical protein